MLTKHDLVKINPFLYEVPRSYRKMMKVPAWIFASEKLLEDILKDRSLEQLINMTTLPGIVGQALVMPDAHEGYGFPIGGVAATKYPDGVISPGGIGYDINCGVRLLLSKLNFTQIQLHLHHFANLLYQEIPSGVGRGGRFKMEKSRLDCVLNNGVPYIIQEGFGEVNDLKSIESSGFLKEADVGCVSDHAKKRGSDQLGTMGAGNHFVEVDVVNQILDEVVAESFGLFLNQIVILIHTGSRGLGHQVATDYIRAMMKAMRKYKISLPDRELACAPFSKPEGKNYFAAMSAAANFAWCNRQLITYEVRNAWQKVFGANGGNLNILYDVAHNIAKIEKHKIGGIEEQVIVHRKGATRAFPKQPVIIPGSMGTASYVLVGTDQAMKLSFGSTCHGAGRRMSRSQAKREIYGENLKKELEKGGVHVKTGSFSGLAEEAPKAYKDIHSVVEIVHQAGIAKKVAKLKPIAVVKG